LGSFPLYLLPFKANYLAVKYITCPCPPDTSIHIFGGCSCQHQQQ